MRSLKDLDKSALILAKTCTLILETEISENDLRDAIFTVVSKENIAQSIIIINEIVNSGNYTFQDEMVDQYGRVCRFLHHLLNEIDFKAASAGKDMLEALCYLRELNRSRKKTLENVPLGIIPKSWERLVFDQGKKVNKRAYTMCVLERLQDKLRRRDIYVENSDRWGDPREKLLSEKDWAINKLQICRTLGHPLSVDEAIQSLTTTLDNAYHQAEASFSTNSDIRIEIVDEKPTLTITNLDKLNEPPSLIKLRQQIADFLPSIDLTELLLEIHAHTGFANEFTHISESNSRTDDLAISVCAVLLSEACNIGIDPFIKHNNPALTRHRLNWVKQNYMRAETLTAANSQLVNHHMEIPLSQAWGGDEVASADGMRFATSVKTINSGPNKKYFGSNRGITWYNFISDQFSGFHSIVVPGTLRDSIFVLGNPQQIIYPPCLSFCPSSVLLLRLHSLLCALRNKTEDKQKTFAKWVDYLLRVALEGLLEQQTRLSPIEIMTDTAGSSDKIFGLFWLLGYQFSPRLADAGESSFWRIDLEVNYGALDELASNCVKTNRIIQHWEDMLRTAGSLKLGKIQASELIRSLLKSERPSSLARAIIDLGRINKTIYLLNFIDNKDYRRRILTQLNRGEGRHAVARVICHGQRGEIKKCYREGQEDQLGALGLVTNAVVLWNTLYMNKALNHMLAKGEEINLNDIGRLSPLQHSHINVLGHYSFVLTDLISKGILRPLNN